MEKKTFKNRVWNHKTYLNSESYHKQKMNKQLLNYLTEIYYKATEIKTE